MDSKLTSEIVSTRHLTSSAAALTPQTPHPITPQPQSTPQSTPLSQTPQPQIMSQTSTPTSISMLPAINSVVSEYSDTCSEAPASVYSGSETLYSPVDGQSNGAPIYSPPSSISVSSLPSALALAPALSTATLSHDALYPATAVALSQVTLPHHSTGMQPHLPQVYPAYYPLEYPTLRPDYRTYQSYASAAAAAVSGRPLAGDDGRSQYPSPYPPPYHL